MSLSGLLLFVATNAQTPQLSWAKTFGNTIAATDSTSVMKLYNADNSVYIAGTSDAYGKGNDIVLIKRDFITGEIIWTKVYNGPANGDDQAVDMVIDQTNGDVFVTGKSMGNSTGYDVVTLKYASNGDLKWTNRRDNNVDHGDDIPKSIGIDTKGNVYIGGTSYCGTVDLENIFALKYDNSGAMSSDFANLFTDNGAPWGHSRDFVGSMKVNNRGEMFFTGEIMRGDLTNGWQVTYSFSQSFQSCGLGFYCGNLDNYSTDCVGTSLNRRYSGFPKGVPLSSPDDFNYFNAMDLDNTNNVYMAYMNDSIQGTGNGYRICIAKVNGTGCPVWEKKYGKSPNAKNLGAKTVKADSNGNVYVAGFEKNTSGNLDWFVIKYNSTGGFVWRKTKNGTASGDDVPYDLTFDNYLNPIVVGSTKNTGTNKDITIVKYNKLNGAELFSINYDSNSKDECAYNVVVDGGQSILVNGIQNSGTQTSKMLTLRYCNPPAAAGAISGVTSVCQGPNTVIYSIDEIENASSYFWTLPEGVTGTSTTNHITVNYSSTFISGNNSVYGRNDCSDGSASSLAITANPLPANAGAITGTAIVCQGSNSVTYTVPVIENATSYIWTFPKGVSGISTTNSSSVIYSSSSVSGNITVKGHNLCGDGALSTLAITVNAIPSSAGIISGNATVCQGQKAVNYTVPVIANATSYIWTLPDGVTGTSTTNSISVDYSMSATSGGIEVFGRSSCGDGSPSIIAVTVNPSPAAAGSISGSATVCQGENSITYSVPTIANATYYIWTLPAGASGTSSTKSITVNYGASAVSGEITVKGHFSCGDGDASTLAVTVNPLPAIAGTISGNTTVCQGQNSVIYAVPTITNATSYIWTLPAGASGTSTTKTIVVNYESSAVSGNITVKGNNSCGDGASSILPVKVNATPVMPTVTTNGNALHSTATNGNQWYNADGIIAGATSQDYTPKTSGDYYVIVTNNSCTSVLSNSIKFIPTGIEPAESAKSVKVYPNPVANELVIEIEGNTIQSDFEILNSLGQAVFNGTIIEKTVVQTSSFAPGVYVIKLGSGKTFEFKKIIKN